MSFRRRMVLLAASAVAVAIVLASLIVYLAVRDELRSGLDEDLRADAAGVFAAPVRSATGPVEVSAESTGPDDIIVVTAPARAAREGRVGGHVEVSGPSSERAPVPGPSVERLVLPPGPLGVPELYAQLVDRRGEIVFPVRGSTSLPGVAEAKQVAAGEREDFFTDAEVDGVNFRVLTAQTNPGEAIQVARSLAGVDDALADLLVVLILVSAGGVALAAVLGVFVSKAALAPVASLSEVAAQVARTRDLSRRIELGGGDELDELAVSFNEMLSELERSVDAQKQLVADASHELRTPITSLRTNIEVLSRAGEIDPEDREQLLGGVVTQLDELTALVSDLVDLARDAEQGEERIELRLDQLAEDVTERARRYFPDVSFEFAGAACELSGYPGALERAIFNLLDNAAKWSRPGGRVEVAVAETGELTVRDHGPGIAAEEIPHVFDRFFRSDEARGLPGSGLGLAIVRQIAEAHGGTAEAEAPQGGGALLRLRLPTSPQRSSN